jgi:hypothetical protein
MGGLRHKWQNYVKMETSKILTGGGGEVSL